MAAVTQKDAKLACVATKETRNQWLFLLAFRCWINNNNVSIQRLNMFGLPGGRTLARFAHVPYRQVADPGQVGRQQTVKGRAPRTAHH